MKTILQLTFALLAICTLATTAHSQGISYQAVARNAAGEAIINHTISVRFSVRESAIAGPVVYSETHTVMTNALGLFSVVVGQGSPVTGTFSTIDWPSNSKFLQVEMDTAGGSAFVDMGTQQMMSVPFALYAENSGRTVGAVNYAGTWDAQNNLPLLSGSTGRKGDYYVVSTTGSHDLNGITDWGTGDWAIYNGSAWEKVDNSEAPVAADNVAFTPNGDLSSINVQDAIVEIRDETDTKLNSKVNRAGDTMTGDLILNADPTLDLGAVTKQYVDGQFGDLIDSYIHKTDDGVSIYLPPGSTHKRFGIGNTQPGAPLGIVADSESKRVISIQSENGVSNENWMFGLRSLSGDSIGFNLIDSSNGSIKSRIFLNQSTGMVGIGTELPASKLHIADLNSDGSTDMKIENNAASSVHSGWLMGHLHSSTSTIRNGSLIFSEPDALSPGSKIERITILPGGNVGINESVPDVKLHVSRPVSDPLSDISLIEGTGIVVIGPMTDNIVADYRGIQARHGEYIGPVLDITTSTLNLQRLGGDILINGSSTSDEQKIIIKDNGRIGIGVLSPSERMEISGKFIVGNDDPQISGQSTAGKIINTATNTGGGQDDHRIGLEINCSGTWSSNAQAKNIGLYVSGISGQSSNNSNIAAVLNGNTVIGDLTSASPIGSDGKNVLVIQNGVSPASPPTSSVPNGGGVQVFSESDVTGTSVFHVMNGDGHVIQLSKQSSLTTPDNTPVSNIIYGATEADVINNLRTRINELEAKLQALGLLN